MSPNKSLRTNHCFQQRDRLVQIGLGEKANLIRHGMEAELNAKAPGIPRHELERRKEVAFAVLLAFLTSPRRYYREQAKKEIRCLLERGAEAVTRQL